MIFKQKHVNIKSYPDMLIYVNFQTLKVVGRGRDRGWKLLLFV